MKRELNAILEVLSSHELNSARDGAMKIMLIFESTENGFLDRKTAELFPDVAFDCGYSRDDVDELVFGVIGLIERGSLHSEVESSLAWALTKLYRPAVLRFFADLLCETKDVKNLCERTDSLNYVANYVSRGVPDALFANLERLREVLKDIEFSDAELRESKHLIMG